MVVQAWGGWMDGVLGSEMHISEFGHCLNWKNEQRRQEAMDG